MASQTKTLKDVQDFIDKTARYYGWAVISDDGFRTTVAEGLLASYWRYGFFQCPCRDSYGDIAHDRDIMCPCTYCWPDIEEYGQCFCGLFVSKGFEKEGHSPTSIPERRPDEYFPY